MTTVMDLIRALPQAAHDHPLIACLIYVSFLAVVGAVAWLQHRAAR